MDLFGTDVVFYVNLFLFSFLVWFICFGVELCSWIENFGDFFFFVQEKRERVREREREREREWLKLYVEWFFS